MSEKKSGFDSRLGLWGYMFASGCLGVVLTFILLVLPLQAELQECVESNDIFIFSAGKVNGQWFVNPENLMGLDIDRVTTEFCQAWLPSEDLDQQPREDCTFRDAVTGKCVDSLSERECIEWEESGNFVMYGCDCYNNDLDCQENCHADKFIECPSYYEADICECLCWSDEPCAGFS